MSALGGGRGWGGCSSFQFFCIFLISKSTKGVDCEDLLLLLLLLQGCTLLCSGDKSPEQARCFTKAALKLPRCQVDSFDCAFFSARKHTFILQDPPRLLTATKNKPRKRRQRVDRLTLYFIFPSHLSIIHPSCARAEAGLHPRASRHFTDAPHKEANHMLSPLFTAFA